MNTRLTISMLASLAVTEPLAAGTSCDPLPRLEISDVRAILIGDTLRKDRVIDGTACKDSEPLRSAEVRLYSGKKLIQHTTTDAHGHFLLENLRLGRYTLWFEGLGSFGIEVALPSISQQAFYAFTSRHGCLSWGYSSD